MAGSTQKSENELFIEILGAEEDHHQKIIKIVRTNHQVESKPEHLIFQKAPLKLRESDVHKNYHYFDPKTVSLGLYHHRKDLLKQMDYLKVDAVRWFVSLFRNPNSDDDQARNTSSLHSPSSNLDDEVRNSLLLMSDDEVRKIYDCFVTKASRYSPSLKNLYADDDTIKHLKDTDITLMMFLDGCFLLHFIHQFLKRPEELMKTTRLHHSFILRDMFLLENQIPYRVLKSLMKLMSNPKALTEEEIKRFIHKFVLHENFPLIPFRMNNEESQETLHLLHILRNMIIGPPIIKSKHPPYVTYYCRSIMELKPAGIKLCKSNYGGLGNIRFNKGLIHGNLSLPQMKINARTRTQLLNLIAYEMCPGFPSERVITSYVWFMDCLINNVDDVKEFQSKNILINCLGSNEDVVKLFNKVKTNSTPDHSVYGSTLQRIQQHCEEIESNTCLAKLKVRLFEMLNTYFSSPWTFISLMAAIFLLFLTVVQTCFTVW